MSPELSRYLHAAGRLAALGAAGHEAAEKAFRREVVEAYSQLRPFDLAVLRRETPAEAPGCGSRNAELYYPRTEGARGFVTCELFDVRAARDLRLQYDFERDGWSVQVPADEGATTADAPVDEQWKEAAFIEG